MNIKKGLVVGITTAAIFVGGGVASASVDPNSIVDYLDSVGKDSSFSNRAQIANSNGIDNYRGTEGQNVYLLGKLKGDNTVAYTEPIKKEQTTENPTPQRTEQNTNTTPTATSTHNSTGQTFTVKATAYTAYCNGCSGVTATGQNLRENPNQKVIAVDPNVIPLGSKVIVEGYGEYLAGDVGGAIKGNKIDIFMPNKSDAINFGVKSLNVTVIK